MTLRIHPHVDLASYALATRTPTEAAKTLAGRRAPTLKIMSVTAAASAPDGGDDATATKASWTGIIGFEGQLTGDGRLIEDGALTWDDTPQPLRHVTQDVGGHDGAVTVGRILTIERGDDGSIQATGDFDTSEYAVEAARMVSEDVQTGISMDLDSVSFEVRVAKDVIDQEQLDADGEAEAEEPDKDGRVTVVKISADDEVMVTTSARIRGATLCAIPAFADARISLSGETEPAESDDSLAASIAVDVDAPPRAWFDNPGLTEPTPVTVTDDGRIYGHIATWGTCHIGFPGQCVQPPHSEQNYRMFELGAAYTAEGDQIPVGHITLDTVHAGKRLSASQTLAHYENTGAVAADVAAGEDEVGIWIAGAVRPGLSAEKVRELRSAPMSGDWRRVGGSLELVAVLAVNVPGFPVPRPQGLVASGEMMTLVASGMIPPGYTPSPEHLSEGDLAALRRMAVNQRRAEAAVLASRTMSLRVAHLAARVNRLTTVN